MQEAISVLAQVQLSGPAAVTSGNSRSSIVWYIFLILILNSKSQVQSMPDIDRSQIASKFMEIRFQMVFYFALIKEKITEKKAVSLLFSGVSLSPKNWL